MSGALSPTVSSAAPVKREAGVLNVQESANAGRNDLRRRRLTICADSPVQMAAGACRSSISTLTPFFGGVVPKAIAGTPNRQMFAEEAGAPFVLERLRKLCPRCRTLQRFGEDAVLLRVSGTSIHLWIGSARKDMSSEHYRETYNADTGVRAEEHGGKCLSSLYLNSHSPLKWRCAKGHEWFARPSDVKSGDWCLRCFRGRGQFTMASEAG
jgi:hypothetical protein